MEVEAVTAAFRWLENTIHTHIVIVTDSESILRKVRTGMLRAEWHASLRRSRMKSIAWIFSLQVVPVCWEMNWRTDWLALHNLVEY